MHFSHSSFASDRGRGGRAALSCLSPGRGWVQQKSRHVQRLLVPLLQAGQAILARNHIKYSILDATTQQVQEVMLLQFGDTAVPRTVVGGVLVEGVDESRIKQLCR